MECFRCGISEEKALLFETVTSEGVEKVCRKCSFDIDSPLIKAPSQERLRESQMKKSVYDRLSHSAGLDAEKHKAKLEAIERKRKEIMSGKDDDLKELVNKNLGNLDRERPEKFVNNFHWIIMRSRRSRRITRLELARAIGEPEEAIKILERGELPRGNEIIVKKIENYLGINLFKKDVEQPMNTSVEVDKMRRDFLKKVEDEPKELFDRKNPNKLKISDLEEMKKSTPLFAKNPRVFEETNEPTLKIGGEKIQVKRENLGEEPEFIEKDFIGKPLAEDKMDDLSDEEINDLIFGK